MVGFVELDHALQLGQPIYTNNIELGLDKSCQHKLNEQNYSGTCTKSIATGVSLVTCSDVCFVLNSMYFSPIQFYIESC